MLFDSLPAAVRDRLYQAAHGRRVLLPEAGDERVQEAARLLREECHITCLLQPADCVTPAQTLQVMEERMQQRGSKALSPKTASLCEDPYFLAGAALALGHADAVVAGCACPTAHVIRAALNTVGLAAGVPSLTSAFLLSLPRPTPGGASVLVYADAAVIPNPTPEELSTIAWLSGEAFTRWTGESPRLSFLSFSTQGSAHHPSVTAVQQACALFAKQHPNISWLFQGEVQFDAACSPQVSARKMPQSPIGGTTNVFIFPDLNAANIGYKMAQYLGQAQAWGPILLGSAKPLSDLSRGASASDIAHTAVLTLALAGHLSPG